MIFIGYSRAEAIDWVQETLGPITPRNIAEDTFRSLIGEGVVRIDADMVVLTEEMDQDDLRVRARNTIITGANQQAGRRRAPRSGNGMKHTRNHNRHNRMTDCSADKTNSDPSDDETEQA